MHCWLHDEYVRRFLFWGGVLSFNLFGGSCYPTSFLSPSLATLVTPPKGDSCPPPLTFATSPAPLIIPPPPLKSRSAPGSSQLTPVSHNWGYAAWRGELASIFLLQPAGSHLCGEELRRPGHPHHRPVKGIGLPESLEGALPLNPYRQIRSEGAPRIPAESIPHSPFAQHRASPPPHSPQKPLERGGGVLERFSPPP